MAKKKNGAKKAEGEMAAVKDVFGALEPLNPIQRGRVLASVQALLEIPRAGLLEKAAEDAEAKQTDGRGKSRSTSGRKPRIASRRAEVDESTEVDYGSSEQEIGRAEEGDLPLLIAG